MKTLLRGAIIDVAALQMMSMTSLLEGLLGKTEKRVASN
jgi:hypothetical protein